MSNNNTGSEPPKPPPIPPQQPADRMIKEGEIPKPKPSINEGGKR